MRTVRADDLNRQTAQGIAAARSRDLAKASQTIADLKQILGDTGSYQYAQIHAQSGDKEAAFADLNVVLLARDPGLIYAKTDPFLDPIRDDPRYPALIRKLNFP